ncbi:hypothetical protein BDR26DRAFT_864389 [Obelidium mucronatum]|nr:hypothetical protein BDR26DRAFT_864389 [Obelidium mucronatum]
MKAIKRELKEWEHEFVSLNGRKPDKKDIANDKAIAKKYKSYAKMKAEGVTEDDETQAAKRVYEATLRTSIKISADPEISQQTRKHKSANRATSRAAEDNSGSGDALETHEESFKTVSNKVQETGVFSEYTQPLLQQQQQRHMHSSDTVIDLDDEDRAAMDFFNNTYVAGNGKFSISKEELYSTTTAANISMQQQQNTRSFSIPEYSRSTAGAAVLPNNFKMRKSTIATGPIATDERTHSEAQNTREYQRDSFYRESEDSSFTLRTFTPPPNTQPETQYASPRALSAGNPELQEFMHRRQQIHEIHNSSNSPVPSTPPITSSTPPPRTFTPQPRAPSALGSYTTVPALTQIRVVTPTTVSATPFIPEKQPVNYLEQQERDEMLHRQQFTKTAATGVETSPKRRSRGGGGDLDLPIPGPPQVVQVDDFEDDSEEDDEENVSTTVVSSRMGNGRPTKGVVVVPRRQSKRSESIVKEAEPAVVKRKEEEEMEEEEVVPFNSSSKTLVTEKKTKKAEAAAKVKKEEKMNFEVDDEEKNLFVAKKEDADGDVKTEAEADAIAVIEKETVADEVVPAAVVAPTFYVNPKLFSRIPQDFLLKCRVQRKKNLLDKTHPTFYLYNETDDKFLLAARKRKKSATVNYLISTSMDDLSKDSTHYIAKLKANFQRTNFIIHDARFYNKNTSGKGLKELASKTVLPRELNVAIPAVTIDENSDAGTKDIMADIKSQNKEKLLFLKNKPPRWNETTQSHCLNFGGRVTQPSIKNFQLVMEGSEAIILQFGRCGPDVFTLDARWPMTPIEAFAVAITTFDAYDSA